MSQQMIAIGLLAFLIGSLRGFIIALSETLHYEWDWVFGTVAILWPVLAVLTVVLFATL